VGPGKERGRRREEKDRREGGEKARSKREGREGKGIRVEFPYLFYK